MPIKYYAQCAEQHGLELGWEGPRRATYERAQKDADDHKLKWKGHEPQVLED